MNKLIDLNEWPVERVLDLLLQDKTTKKNIIFATNAYSDSGYHIDAKAQLTRGMLLGLDPHVIQPRVAKEQSAQSERTKAHAEVFTPSWLCNKMNNHLDEEWFGRKGVFNIENEDHTWTVTEGKIEFPKENTWQEYVESKRLEITCGEAPYLVSRYDTTSGENIPIARRIGLLDRKLRVVNENTADKESWLTWTVKAFQSVYGYEWQGDNLLIARVNILMTFVEYMMDRWSDKPSDSELKKIANIIVWNLWQMDGLTGTTPLGAPVVENEQLGLDLFGDMEDNEQERSEPCRIYDWKANKSFTYNSIKGER